MVPYLPYEKMEQSAVDFLDQHGGYGTLPIDVEAIVEFRLDMNIIAMPGLQSDISIEGFLTSDFKSIYVDEHVFTNIPVRYRFTLAHELGHLVLHAGILRSHLITSVDEWKAFVSNFNSSDYGWMEYQGYCFGGALLVPPAPLRRGFDEHFSQIEELAKKAKEAGFPRDTYLPYTIASISEWLAPDFDVSEAVIQKRIEKSGLHKDIP